MLPRPDSLKRLGSLTSSDGSYDSVRRLSLWVALQTQLSLCGVCLLSHTVPTVFRAGHVPRTFKIRYLDTMILSGGGFLYVAALSYGFLLLQFRAVHILEDFILCSIQQLKSNKYPAILGPHSLKQLYPSPVASFSWRPALRWRNLSYHDAILLKFRIWNRDFLSDL